MSDIYQEILNQMHEGVYYCSKDRKITFWNKAAEKITGYTKGDMLDSYCYNNYLQHIDESGEILCKRACPLAETIKTGQPSERKLFLHHKDGHRVPVTVRITPTYNNKKEIDGAIEVFTEQSNRLEILKDLSNEGKKEFIDEETGFTNHKFANIRLEKRIDRWKEIKVPFAIFFISVDNIDDIEKNLGKKIAQKSLVMTAKSINNALSPIDLLCRWENNEFLVIAPNVNLETIKNIGDKIKLFIQNSWIYEKNGSVSVKTSIGCSHTQKIDDAIEDIISRAKDALEASKKLNNSTVVMF
jgi:diguanylate cyclase (GGDEF)-like protein/PAS domain S-box-containing protein